MSNFAKYFFRFLALGLMAILSLPGSASAITAELAKKCQAMAAKAHPMALPGSKVGTAKAERDYFAACIKNNGTTPDSDTQNTTVPAAK